MDQNLLNLIHKYAEDREIDWVAAKIIGEQQGLVFKNENELSEWKNVVDRYLKTFNASDFEAIEEACKKGKKKKEIKESEDKDNGEQKQYYPNGKLYKQWFMKNGKYHGECKIYDKEGKLFKKIMYNNGQMVNDYTK